MSGNSSFCLDITLRLPISYADDILLLSPSVMGLLNMSELDKLPL